jgi:glycosyltransferase involved in cell wall biosynthesis
VADPAPEDRSTAVAVAYVYNGHNVTYSWHHSVIELLGWDITHEGRVMRGGYVAMKGSTDGLADARNKAVKLFLAERQADWLFWVDTDMGFSPDTVDRLLAAADPEERPVVGALAFTQQEVTPDQMGGWRCRAAPTVYDWTVLDDGQMGFSVRWKYPPDALVKVGGTGSACVLIHRSVFERVEAKFGRVWYDRVPNTTTGQVLSEDLALCLRAGALDIPIHVHTGVRTTHQKTLWLGEDDYYGQVALSQLVPQVPAATEETAVIVPVLRRPGNAAPFMASLKASGAPLARVYAVTDADDTETAAAWREAGAQVLTWHGPSPGTFAQKVNIGYRATSEPWLLLAGDDVKFHPGWLDQAQHAARDGADVIGTNDLHNPRVTAGDHSPHPMVRRAYIDEQGASWDGPGTVAHEGYGHWFVDDELVTAAKQRGAWAAAPHAKVEHLHPLWGLAADDETYALGRGHIEADKALFEKRLAEHSA